MAKKESRSNRQQNASQQPQPPTEQVVSGRLYGSQTELERTFDGRHDISNVDCQEGNMNHGTKGGCFDDKEEGYFPRP